MTMVPWVKIIYGKKSHLDILSRKEINTLRPPRYARGQRRRLAEPLRSRRQKWKAKIAVVVIHIQNHGQGKLAYAAHCLVAHWLQDACMNL